MNVQSAGFLKPSVSHETTSRAQSNQALSKEMAQEFESLMLSQLIKQMRQSSGGEGLFPGDKSDTYGGMFDMMMASHLTENGGFGFADQLVASLPVHKSAGDEAKSSAEHKTATDTYQAVRSLDQPQA